VIRVVVVDDHAVVRAGLEQVVGLADDVELVGSAADGSEEVGLVRCRYSVFLMLYISLV